MVNMGFFHPLMISLALMSCTDRVHGASTDVSKNLKGGQKYMQ